MIVGAATHNAGAAIFLLVTVGVPLVFIIVGSVAGRFDQPRQRRLKSHRMPERENRAGYVESKQERKRGSLR